MAGRVIQAGSEFSTTPREVSPALKKSKWMNGEVIQKIRVIGMNLKSFSTWK